MGAWDNIASPVEENPWDGVASALPEAKEATAIPSAQQMPVGEQLARQLGLTGRYLMNGAMAIPNGVGDLANTGINAVTSGVNSVAGTDIPKLGMPSQTFNHLLTQAGYPEPQTRSERNIGTASELLASFTPGGESVVNGVKQGARNLAEMLTPEQKAAQVSSEQGRRIASYYYDSGAEKGGQIPPATTDKIIEGANSVAKPQTAFGNVVSGSEDEITKLLSRLESQRGKPLSLAEAEEADKILGQKAWDNFDPKTGYNSVGKSYKDIQNTLRSGMSDMASGAADAIQPGFADVQMGVKSWAQAAKIRDIEAIVEKTKNMKQPASSLATALNTYKSKPANLAGWTDAEKKALDIAAKNGTGVELMNMLGSRLTPYVAGGVGAVGGPVGALGSMAAAHFGGAAARSAALKLQMRPVNNLLGTLSQFYQK